jgi:hypothetical protein
VHFSQLTIRTIHKNKKKISLLHEEVFLDRVHASHQFIFAQQKIQEQLAGVDVGPVNVVLVSTVSQGIYHFCSAWATDFLATLGKDGEKILT